MPGDDGSPVRDDEAHDENSSRKLDSAGEPGSKGQTGTVCRPGGVPMRLLAQGSTAWTPESLPPPALSVSLDACVVPSPASAAGARLSLSNAIVLDGLVEDALRAQLLEALVGPEAAEALERGEPTSAPPTELWERATADGAGAAPTWGLRPAALAHLTAWQLPALRELGARLAALFPDADVAFLPSDAIQRVDSKVGGDSGSSSCVGDEHNSGGDAKSDGNNRGGKRARREEVHSPASQRSTSTGGGPTQADCACVLANAAVPGDEFSYHVDADPTSFPDGTAWTDAYGDYFNGEPGAPLLASLVLYLNPVWRRDWLGETLLLDGAGGVGVAVAPTPGRALLLHQDVTHRLCAPSRAAPAPRFSLVLKLALLPRRPGGAVDLARATAWGRPLAFGSAARLQAIQRRLLAETQNSSVA